MPAHNDGDLYVNEGSSYAENGAFYPGDPEERVEDEKAAVAAAAASFPIMKEVADWFEEQQKLASDIDNIQTTSLTINGVKYTRTVSIEGQALAYQLLRGLLKEKAVEFAGFRSEDEE